jgi:hypothetical protein
MVAIDKYRVKGISFSRFIDEYRSSLKPPETEEPINQILNRPLAFGAAKIFQKMRVSPNMVTAFSLLCGISSGVFFAGANEHDVIWAAVLLQMMIFFDCADGQLARMTKRSSRFGRIIDTFADLATHGAIYTGVAISLYRTTGSAFSFFIALSAQISMYLHMALYDHFKNVFISVTKPGHPDLLDSLKHMKDRAEQNDNRKSRLSRVVAKLYVWFYRMESKVVAVGYPAYGMNLYERFPDSERIDPGFRELYNREMKVPTKLWAMIGDTIHLEIFVICGLLNKPTLIFPCILVYTNVVMLAALFVQRVRYRRLGLEVEVMLQEGYD